jgi:hypothetical protein
MKTKILNNNNNNNKIKKYENSLRDEKIKPKKHL